MGFSPFSCPFVVEKVGIRFFLSTYLVSPLHTFQIGGEVAKRLSEAE